MYRPTMLNQSMWVPALLLGCISVSGTDVLRLKENAAVAGKILAQKPDQVVIDIGYTVLTVPRAEIVNISTDAIGTAGNSGKSDAPQVVRTGITSAPAGSRNTGGQTAEKPSLFHRGDGTLPERSVRELVSLLGEAVVQVRTPSGLGSGFILNDEGYLITNFHVIESETQIAVEVYHQTGEQLDRRGYKQVRIVAMNKYADLALLKIEDKDAPKFASVALGDSDELGVGERVFAIGSPMGLERTVTEGIVSSKTRPMQGELYLQTTTQINPGNSGGPLFNLRGEVVGVTNMKIAFGEGLGFAIPVETVSYFLSHRDAFAYDNDNPSSPYRYLEPPNRLNKRVPAR
jgi:serine protease Do